MKKLILVLLVAFLQVGVFAQSLNYNDPLPIDQRVVKGKLPNGMTYYIQNSTVTKDVASYYIFQNVGSVLEEDDQQGLAHFLEHMAFNGTQNYEGKGILNMLQEYGAVFGKDINAYTSFNETVYNLNNIPTNKDGLVDKCLLILHDWCNYLSLKEEEIDAERGVIKEEWRTRQSGQMRIFEKTFPTMFNHTKYADRMPIGKMDIVENFEYKALRDFYHDWYRTDLQAIAIVGDFDVVEMEAKIKKLFSDITAIENPKERFEIKIPDNKELLFDIAMDDEVATSSISFSIRHNKSLENETVADLKTGLQNSMISNMMSTRITELSQDPEASFVGAGVSYGNANARLHEQLNIRVSPKPNQQQAAFKSVLTEVIRAVKFGFMQGEIERTKIVFASYYENQIAKIDDASHGALIGSMKSNYLENSPITDIVKEYELTKQLFSEMTIEEIQVRMQEMYTQKNRTLIVTGVDGNKNLTKEEGLAIINDVENDTSIAPYVEEIGGSLMDGTDLKSGTIVSSIENNEIGSTTFELSNGIKVHYKFADKNKNDVKLQAISDGGKSLIAVEDYASNEFLGSLIQMSGLGEFSMTDLPKVLAGKTANTSVSIGRISESVSGSSSTKDVETMLQLVNLRFTHPRFDEKSFEVLKQQISSYLIRKGSSIGSKMQDSITTTLYGDNNSQRRIITPEYVAEASFDVMKAIYKERFRSASDFEFFIVGDVKQEDLAPLLEKYIASIPTTKDKEEWLDNGASWLNEKTDKDIYLKMEDPKATVRIAIKNEMNYSLKNAQLMSVLGDVLQLRLTESLRETEGGTYGAGSRGQLFKKPKQQAYLSVSFDCNPDKVEKLVSIVHGEIETIANGDILQADLDKTLTNYLKEREEAKNYNNYEMSLLRSYVLEGYSIDNPDNFENIINNISSKDLQKVTKKLLKGASSYEIVFKPELEL